MAATNKCLAQIIKSRTGLQDGTLRAKIMVKQTTTESHLWHYAFMARDRIRTGELNPWTCVLCERDYSGLQTLSVLGVIDDPREAPRKNKPAVVTLVCVRQREHGRNEETNRADVRACRDEHDGYPPIGGALVLKGVYRGARNYSGRALNAGETFGLEKLNLRAVSCDQ